MATDDVVFARTRCRSCGVESKGYREPTVVPGLVLAYCVICKKKTPADDLGDVTRGVHPLRVVEDDTLPPDRVEFRDTDGTVVGSVDLGRTVDLVGTSVATVDLVADDAIQRAYEEWRATDDGREVVAAIRARALDLRRRGWSHYGIKALGEVVRFDQAIRVGPDAEGYRVNNSHLSRLARDLMAEEAELRDFFEVRDLRAVR